MANPVMFDRAALRAEIARLKTENETLRAQLGEARSNTGEAKANAKLLQEYAAYKEHIRRCVADFDAGCRRINDQVIAQVAKEERLGLWTKVPATVEKKKS
jgi:cytochrome c556